MSTTTAALETTRATRVRRWCLNTFLAASAGYAIGAVQLMAALPWPVRLAALGIAWYIDLKFRDSGRTRVSQVSGAWPLTVLTIVRVPVSSALTACLSLTPLLTALSHHHR